MAAFHGDLGLAGPEAPPLGERIVRAFADIVDAPGGLLLVSDGGRGLSVAAASDWPGNGPRADAFYGAGDFWTALEATAAWSSSLACAAAGRAR